MRDNRITTSDEPSSPTAPSLFVVFYYMQARLECRDGCNIAVLRCEPGYSCAGGIMSVCTPGTYRNTSYDMIDTCLEVRGLELRTAVGQIAV